MFSLIRNSVQLVNSQIKSVNLNAFYHIFNRNSITQPNLVNQTKLLAPNIINYMPNNGMKVKGRLNRRCKDCFFVKRQGRWYIWCNTHPRHKQMQMMKKEYKTWILTDAAQSKKRPF